MGSLCSMKLAVVILASLYTDSSKNKFPANFQLDLPTGIDIMGYYQGPIVEFW